VTVVQPFNYFTSAMQGANAVQQLQDAQQQAAIQRWQFSQAQQQQRQQQAAMAAAGNALPQLLASGQAGAPQQGQMPPPPQPPQPGQPSQPQQAPQQAGAPMPGQGPAPGAVKPPLPPFRPMPTTPSQAQTAPQGAIPAPPVPQAPPPQQAQQGGPLTMQSAIKVLQDQGLSGADLMAGLQQLTPLLDAQAKQQATQAQQQFNQQFKLAQLNDLEAYHKSELSNKNIDQAKRAKHDDALLGIAQARLGIEQQRISMERQKLAATTGAGAPTAEPADALNPKAAAGYSAEALKALGDDYAQRGPAALAGFGRGNLPPAARAEVVNYAAAKNAQSGGNFATNAIQYKADTAGAQVNAKQAAKVDASANALTQPEGIGDQFQGAIDALDRTGIPVANEAQMQALRLSNDPRVSTYDTAKNGVVSEVAQILGRGQVTVNSMEEARKVIDGWHTSDQARAGLAQLKREAATTVKASSEEVAKSARTPKGQPGLKTAPAAGETRTIGGKTYVQQNGKWYEQ
jgi:hypothetical protein